VVGNVGRMALARWKDLCLDATTPADPQPVARFWADVLELALEQRDDGVTSLRGDPAERTTWVNPVPEPKTVKNRVHLDVRVGVGLTGDERVRALEAEAARLEPLGARRLYLLPADEENESCLVMQDVEGNEFCLD
jgi:hypothetical protein